MMYAYGTNDSFTNSKISATVEELTEIITNDVECGKWNNYFGGVENSISATCSYHKKGYIFHNHLLIYGSKDEFKELENAIKDIIDVTPRQFETES